MILRIESTDFCEPAKFCPMRISFSGADSEYLNCNSVVVSREDVEREGLESIDYVVAYVFATEPRAHKSFFKTDGTLANGTICLVDDQDIEAREDKKLGFDSEVVFISTLHGG
jgi:hypothetical protein